MNRITVDGFVRLLARGPPKSSRKVSRLRRRDYFPEGGTHNVQKGTRTMPITGTTGHTCTVSGIYQGSCRCGKQIALSRGEVFPPCHNVHGPITWTLIRQTR